MPGLWKHKTKPIQFVLVVDDFGIKYINKDDLDHLIRTLEKYYEVAVDLDGKEFVKIKLIGIMTIKRFTCKWSLTSKKL